MNGSFKAVITSIGEIAVSKNASADRRDLADLRVGA